jgi:hypothetical protein
MEPATHLIFIGIFLAVLVVVLGTLLFCHLQEAAKPRRIDFPKPTMVPVPEWVSVTTTTTVSIAPEEAQMPVPTSTEEMETLIREFNRCVDLAQFDEALEVAEEIAKLASETPKPKKAETPPVGDSPKTRFDIIG